MNETVNKLLLAENKFITELHLRQPVFSYSAIGIKKESKNLCKQETIVIFIRTI